ncbi:MAG: outer membrane protein assembly factor BamB [Betaproteobacteria bacterium]
MKRLVFALALAAILAACSTGSPRPKPADLQAINPTIGVRQAWSQRLARIDYPAFVQVHASSVVIGTGEGTVVELDAATGRELWRTSVGAPLSAGVGSDGKTVAVVTRNNELVALREGRVAWRQRLAAQAFSAPLVAGARVFLLTADSAVTAYDGQGGQRLWAQQRPGGDPLVLRQSGVMLPVGDTLLVGLGGRLSGLNPSNGSVRWDVPVASPRGLNEIERLVDLVGPAARQGSVVCARAFQAAVACADAQSGRLQWSRPADGEVGLAVDERLLYGVESDGQVQAWRMSNGERVWSYDRLRFRELTAPLLIGRSVAVGDLQGFVHLLSREDGSPLGRISTDGSAVAAPPVLVGQTLIVVTRSGGVFAFLPL